MKAPWTLARARGFRLPFGRYRGRTVAEVLRSDAGRDWLRWAAGNVAGNVGTAAAIALGIEPAGGREADR
jgi:hypothetical protein